jgi:hypothetical protein
MNIYSYNNKSYPNNIPSHTLVPRSGDVLKYDRNEYYYFVGRTLYDPVKNIRRVIQRMEESPDIFYRMTDGYSGTAYCIYLMVEGSENCEKFHFRNFIEVIQKYGELDVNKPMACLTVKPNKLFYRWAKVYPEPKASLQ